MALRRRQAAPAEAPGTAANELSLGNVCKRYGPTLAVDDVSFSVEPGEFLTILGPSGSGKTTLLHMIAGFVFPDAGSIAYRSTNITYMPAHLRNMGMVFQNYALFPHMSVAQNLAFPLRMRRAGRLETRRRVREALELVGLGARAAHLPSELSGGQQQRVAVARALVYRPSLLLMDEPLGALDKSLRERLQMEIKRIQRATGVTILYVTHDQQEALSMSDRIAVVAGGRLAGIGPSQEIYERPPSRFVAGAIGACNFLAGRVLGFDGEAHRVALGEGIVVRVAGAAPRLQRERAVTVCIRPESLACVGAGGGRQEAANGAPETLSAVVLDAIYLGDVIRYELALGRADSPLCLSTKVLRASAMPVFARGTEVLVRWDIHDAWMIAEESEPGAASRINAEGESDHARLSSDPPADPS